MIAAVAMVAAGCGRSSKSSSNANTSTTSGGSADLASGDFGTLKKVCGPGSAKGATD
jgi:hypothetical protein